MALAISALRYNYVTIQHPDQKKKSVELSSHLVQTEYFENLLSPVITMKMRIRSEFNLVSNLPIRGGEMIAFSAEVGGTTLQFGEIDDKGNITPDTGELYVYKLSDLSTPSQAQDFILNITSLEYFKNETSRCQFKFKPQTIDQHVKQILGPHVMNVNPDKVLPENIEGAKNTYTFIGNNRKPFYTISWLCPKAIGGQTGQSAAGIVNTTGSNDVQGTGTAGFLFYENREGFNFKSIESLVRSTRLDNSEKKSVYSYEYRGKGATGNPNNPDENTNIIFYYLNKSTDVRQALAVGQYHSKTIFYDSLAQKFDQIEYKLEKQIGEDSTLGGYDENDDKELPVPKGLDERLSRMYSIVSDHGALGVGELGLEASGRDPVDHAKAISRYNALFSQSLNIQVPCNTNLKVGDIINLTFPEILMGESRDPDSSMSGNYLISRLNHHIQPNANYTSLNLIRDAYGNSTAYPVDTLQSTSQSGLSTQELVDIDNSKYGNSYPEGSFNITK